MSSSHKLCVSMLFIGATALMTACHTEPTEPSLEVTASIASVTLADDCAQARIDPGLVAGDCAEGQDCSFCQQTGIRLSIQAAEGPDTVPFEVVSIRLVRIDGDGVQDLSAYAPQLFADDGYSPWNGQVSGGDSLNVTYDTSAPDWSAFGGGDAWTTYGMSFRVEMVVRIDGVEYKLEFEPASREPEVVT